MVELARSLHGKAVSSLSRPLVTPAEPRRAVPLRPGLRQRHAHARAAAVAAAELDRRRRLDQRPRRVTSYELRVTS